MHFISILLKDFSRLSKFQFKNVVKGLIASFVNLLIYVILAALIIGFSQGNVLPIDMFIDDSLLSTAVNISLFHLMLYFLALIMSLYPHYIYIILFGDEEDFEDKEWKSARFGLIYYDPKTEEKNRRSLNHYLNPYYDKPQDTKDPDFIEKAVRKLLAVSLFIVWALLIIYTFNQHQLEDSENITIMSAVRVIAVVLFLLQFYFFTIWLKRYAYENEDIRYLRKNVRLLYRWHIPIFAGILGMHILLVHFFKWTLLTMISQVGVCLLLAMFLTIIRSFRKLIASKSDIRDFLSGIRRLGIIVVLVFIFLNWSTSFSNFINPINILLAGLIMLYTVLTMVIKVYIYLNGMKAEENWKNAYNLIYFWSLTLIFAIFGYHMYCGNKLHDLQLKPKTNPVTLSQFYEKYNPDKMTSPILYAAYGGGLKAHYWNYLILEELEEREQFSNILAVSGVSGGGMGLANFTAMKYLYLEEEQRREIMDKVKGSNILGIELSWFLGADFLREMLPSFGKSRDRSHRSMTYYNDILNDYQSGFDLVNEITFDEVYADLHNRSHYPNLIINSTATNNKSGIVSAVRTDSMFPGSINILDIKGDSTLTYFEAVSTCNRFPYISPAANIIGKGHFVDGGYYENSGVMSLISFNHALEKHDKEVIKRDSTESKLQHKTKILSVRNDKGNYIQGLFETIMDSLPDTPTYLKSNKNYTETGAIFSSMGNLERTPTYLREQIELYHSDEYQLGYLDLPYYIRSGDVTAHFGGVLNDTLMRHMQNLIDGSNDNIEKLLAREDKEDYDLRSIGVVNPPTARILSKPVEFYMKRMMQHERVKGQLNDLCEYVEAVENK